MEEIAAINFLKACPDVRPVLNLHSREELRRKVLEKFPSFKHFSAHLGIPYDTFHNWIKVNDKRREPDFASLRRISAALGFFPEISKLACNNSAREISNLPQKVCLDEEAALAFGLFCAEGDKKTTKRITLTNCSQEAIRFFAAFLQNRLGVKKEEFSLYVYLPEGHSGEVGEVVPGITADRTRSYVNKRSSQPCFILCANNCFAKRLFDGLNRVLEEKMDASLAAPFLNGVLFGDGSISFSPERKYYEICIALAGPEAALAKKALSSLDIAFIERPKPPTDLRLLLIHSKPNFQKILAAGGFAFATDKNIKLANAISAYTYSR